MLIPVPAADADARPEAPKLESICPPSPPPRIPAIELLLEKVDPWPEIVLPINRLAPVEWPYDECAAAIAAPPPVNSL